MNSISKTHGFHRFLETPLFFANNRLDNHGTGINERQNHKERKQARNGHEESVVGVTWVRKLLHVHARQLRPI